MFCRCFTVISRISAFSSLDCYGDKGGQLLDHDHEHKKRRREGSHIKPERSDHRLLQLIQTVVDPLPSFPLDERLPQLKTSQKTKYSSLQELRLSKYKIPFSPLWQWDVYPRRAPQSRQSCSSFLLSSRSGLQSPRRGSTLFFFIGRNYHVNAPNSLPAGFSHTWARSVKTGRSLAPFKELGGES